MLPGHRRNGGVSPLGVLGCLLGASVVLPGLVRADLEDDFIVLPRIVREIGHDQSIYTIGEVLLVVQSVKTQIPDAAGTLKDGVELRVREGKCRGVVFWSLEKEGPRLDKLERLLETRVLQISRVFGLPPEQQEKLRLAGKGDIRRLRQRLAGDLELQNPFVVENEDSIETLRWLAGIASKVADLGDELQEDPFLEGSLLAKVLRHQLTPEQIAEYEQRELKLRVVPLGLPRKAREVQRRARIGF